MKTSNLALDRTGSTPTPAAPAPAADKRRTSDLRRRLASRERPVANSAHSQPPVARQAAPTSARAPDSRALIESRPAWDELLHDLGVGPECLLRNAVPHPACTLAGRFIDVATGKVIVTHRDFALGAQSPLLFDRVWLSSSTYLGPLGHGWHHAYDIALSCRDDTVAVRLSDGRVLGFPAPADGNESVVPHEQLRLSRDTYGFVLRDVRGSELRFVPHRSQHAAVLSSVRTLGGCELRFGYDHRARLVRITSRGDRDLELAYDRTDRLIAIRGADALHAGKRIVLVQFAYDERGNLCKASDALGQARRYAYQRHLMTEAIERTGCTTQFEWDGPDPRARCVHSWVDAGVRDRTLEYAERSTTVWNSFGHATTFGHDGAVVWRIVHTGGHVRELVRGEGRRVERETDELGQQTHYHYEAGALEQYTGPDGASWSFERDPVGRTFVTLDPLGGRWQNVHDSRGRVLRAIDPLGRVTRYHYRGRWLTGMTRPGERHTRYAYDDAGNLEFHAPSGGEPTRYAYDAWNELVAIQNASEQTEEHSYDVLGRLIRVREPSGNACEISYDAEGRPTRWRDRFREMKFTYQGTGQLSSRTDGGATICFEYDAEEQLVGIVNEHGKLFRISRDASGEIVETTGFDGIKRTCTRDGLGRVTRVERADQFSEYDFDAAGRVMEAQHSDGAFEGYRYAADGALLGAWNQDSTVSFERDACRRVTREQHGEQWIGSEYDAAGRRTRLESSLGTKLIFERDDAGRLRRMLERETGFEVRYERDAFGFIVERSLPDGGRCVWQRDAFGRPSGMRHEAASGAIVRELKYEWDNNGRLRRWSDSRGDTADYRYDGRGNLAWRKAADGSYQLRMPDAVGNHFMRDDRRDREYGAAGQTLTRSVRGGEVQSRYDASGQLIERCDPGSQLWRFTWSAAGLLRSVVRPDGTKIMFAYDAFGRRIWKRHAGRTTRFCWDGDRILHECVDGELPITWLYDPDEGYPVAKLSGGDARAVLVDHTGAPSQILDRDGQPLWAANTSITGELRVIDGSAQACWLRWPGMYADCETGLVCEYREGTAARYYDPAAGAYVDQGALAAAPSLRAYGHGYAFGVEWTGTRVDHALVFTSACQRMPQAHTRDLRRVRDLTPSLAPGAAYGPHSWSTTLTPARDYAACARASDTPAFLSAPASHRSVFNEPAVQLTECTYERNPMQRGPLPEPLLSR